MPKVNTCMGPMSVRRLSTDMIKASHLNATMIQMGLESTLPTESLEIQVLLGGAIQALTTARADLKCAFQARLQEEGED